MTLTIGIVNYNTKDELKSCIDSIFKNPPNCNYQIIVVDNDSRDGSKDFLKNIKRKKIKYILNEKNVGFGSACNQIARLSSSPYILFLNPDVKITKNAIDKLIKFLRKNKKVGLVTGKLIYPDGSIQLSCRKFPTILNVLGGRESLLRKIFPNNIISRRYLMTELDYTKIQFPDCVRGAVMLFRREIFEKFGGFDEKFFLYFEDTDFCFRLRKNGFEIAYLPEAIFYHKLGASTDKEKLKAKIAINISMFYYLRKNMGYNFPILFLLFFFLLTRLFFIFFFFSLKEMKE
ncbi:MAG: glycosyltransferase family 2 protein [candidate division WOR-3 bacterium]